MIFEKINQVDRQVLTRVIVTILNSWNLDSMQQIKLLQLPEKTPRRMMRRYLERTPFPESEVTDERMEHLLGIADALRTSFPRNANMGPTWMRQPNRRFDDRSPLAIIVENGLAGLIDIRSHLDCTYSSWA